MMKFRLFRWINDFIYDLFMIFIIIAIMLFFEYIYNYVKIFLVIVGSPHLNLILDSIETIKSKAIILGLILFYFYRVKNKDRLFNEKNIYHDEPYFMYWVSAKILGRKKCSLVLVPIYMQYKLILRSTFEEYPFREDAFPKKACKIYIEKTESKECNKSINVNFIIQDTYPISKNQIPKRFENYKTIFIKRESFDIGERVYSTELVAKVVSELRSLEEGSIVNIFSTTNPKNTYEIVKNGLFIANRGNFKRVYVFQQSNERDREFIDKAYKVV